MFRKKQLLQRTDISTPRAGDIFQSAAERRAGGAAVRKHRLSPRAAKSSKCCLFVCQVVLLQCEASLLLFTSHLCHSNILCGNLLSISECYSSRRALSLSPPPLLTIPSNLFLLLALVFLTVPFNRPLVLHFLALVFIDSLPCLESKNPTYENEICRFEVFLFVQQFLDHTGNLSKSLFYSLISL